MALTDREVDLRRPLGVDLVLPLLTHHAQHHHVKRLITIGKRLIFAAHSAQTRVTTMTGKMEVKARTESFQLTKRHMKSPPPSESRDCGTREIARFTPRDL